MARLRQTKAGYHHVFCREVARTELRDLAVLQKCPRCRSVDVDEAVCTLQHHQA